MLIQDLVNEAARLFSLKSSEITGRSRQAYVARARFALCAALRERGASYPQIGKWLGGRDHSTIIHAVERARYIAERDPHYAKTIERLADFEYDEEPCNILLHDA